MVKGIFTAASGMKAMQYKINTVSNNLANVDTMGYKKDVSCFKAFPEMRMSRKDDDGVTILPIGSYDIRPIVGRLGTGVEHNEVYTQFEQGSLKETSNPFDLALQGKGFIAVQTPDGERYTRNGSFLLDKEGYLVTKDGYKVLGEDGPIKLKKNNFMVKKDGTVYENKEYADDDKRLVISEENRWQQREEVDRIKLVRFPNERYLKKQGESLWKDNNISGPAHIAQAEERPALHQGFLETSNVNPVYEMVNMIEVQRAYEMNSKVVQTQDRLVGKAVNEVGRTI